MTDQLLNARLSHSHPTYPSVSADANSKVDKALRILRMKQVIERTNLSRATLYALAGTDPTFPRKIKLTARTVGYLEQEVEEWILSRAQPRAIVA
ncbi:helix-turn-helix transcriptional regulator [Burkholderia gladioli]|uniref:helix-turn-helix transcriptional regulator n=1 Tax=Burkholderia gladioli TaxID=28095 RepID=UPI000F536BAB|nr:AlpA family phage regulatory protein [Burkholderia gladioli]